MMHLFWVLLDILGIKKDNYDPFSEQLEALIIKAESPPVKDIKEPVSSFVKFLEKHPNYFHLKEKFSLRTSVLDPIITEYTLHDSLNKIKYKVSKVISRHSRNYKVEYIVKSPANMRLSKDEWEYLTINITSWLSIRQEKLSTLKQKKEQKVRDKLTLMYTEE